MNTLHLQTVQQFSNDKLNAENSPALVRYLRLVLRIALNQAVKGDMVVRNVAALATPPKVEKREISPFTAEQACRFLKAAMGHQLETLFTVGLAEIVGHSDIRLTQNVYQHVYQEAKHDAATKMDELLTRVAAENPVATSVATKPTPSSTN